MPIPLTPLDDVTYDDLMAEARSLIPLLAPGWTDHNPSDPGIALAELLAWLTEMVIFQIGEVPDSYTEKFLALLNGPDWTPPAGGDLRGAIADTMRSLDERYRAATPSDYEYLVRATWPGTPAAQALGLAGALRRVRCVPRRDLTQADPQAREEPADTHVTVVVLPEPASTSDEYPQPGPGLTAALWAFLDPRRILTTRHHVVGPGYVDTGVVASLALQDDAPVTSTLDAVSGVLRAAFSPVTGGPTGTGWPFGQAVYASEVYTILEGIDLIDYVEDVRLTGPRPLLATDGSVAGIGLDAHELVRLSSIELTGYDAYGRAHPYTWRVS